MQVLLSPAPNCFLGVVVEHDVAKLEFCIPPVVIESGVVLASSYLFSCELPPPKIDYVILMMKLVVSFSSLA